MKIYPLSEGTFSVDKTKVFMPYDDTRDTMKDRPAGSLLVEVQPFLVISDRDIMVLDGGLGFTDASGTLQIHQALATAGVSPRDVTKVLVTHLHKDHAGGLAMEAPDGSGGVLSFPAATYYIQRKELELALSGSSSYVHREVALLQHASGVTLLEGNGIIDEYITYELTGAHSPFHQVFWIMEGNQKVFFGGDDAPQYGQMLSRYAAKYDFDGKKAMELRQQWWETGTQEHWTFLFYHDFKRAVVEL